MFVVAYRNIMFMRGVNSVSKYYLKLLHVSERYYVIKTYLQLCSQIA
jgi:hypothetical protein